MESNWISYHQYALYISGLTLGLGLGLSERDMNMYQINQIHSKSTQKKQHKIL